RPCIGFVQGWCRYGSRIDPVCQVFVQCLYTLRVMAQRRIGEMARRVGVSPELLRAWERRYGLLEPVRTEAGYRLYSEEDERRVREMLRLVGSGVSPQQAARSVRSAEPVATAEVP